MDKLFSESSYEEMLGKLFHRFPSFQKVGAGAYKPGIANMEFADQLMGHPHKKYDIIHVAGTNGKGSVSNMLASVLAASGLKVGLYTSPHISDFRERIRVVSVTSDGEGCSFYLIPKTDVWSFVQEWKDTFDHLDMSFFEITTMMALDWFAKEGVDIVVLETGLGGRLDSTNIVTPILSVITNIGLDHCDMLGDTLAEIAFEKAGIIKPRVPVVIGESHPDTDPVFERKVLYTNLPEPEYMGNRAAIMSLLTFAGKVEPSLWDRHEEMLRDMDLQGEYQKKNLRTALAAADVLKLLLPDDRLAVLREALLPDDRLVGAIVHTAERVGFHGRWEKLSENPSIICDIGHNEHGLKYNFAQLQGMKDRGECTDLIIVYGSVADKDVESVIHLMPEDATYIFTQSQGKRALPASQILDIFLRHHGTSASVSTTDMPDRSASAPMCGKRVYVVELVTEAVAMAKKIASDLKEADSSARPLIYIGGSTYVVSEAVSP